MMKSFVLRFVSGSTVSANGAVFNVMTQLPVIPATSVGGQTNVPASAGTLVVVLLVSVIVWVPICAAADNRKSSVSILQDSLKEYRTNP